MATILFYTSIRTRVRDQESLMVEFVKQGHKVFFVNQQPNPYLPTICRDAGVFYETIQQPFSSGSIFKTLFYSAKLIAFIWRYNIRIVYSHLEPANFIAVLVQYFVRAKIVVVRHHHDLAELAGFSNDLSYRLTYKLAKNIVVVSEQTRQYMISKEDINNTKIHHINLGYDFSYFGSVDEKLVSQLKDKLDGAVGLITIGRLDKYKRANISIELVKKLRDSGTDAHLWFLGTGEMKDELETLCERYNLKDQIEFIGYSDNVISYLKASHWLIHPSISESSCVVVKEAGIVGLPVIVCKGVGDFDEYLINSVNSFLVSEDQFVDEASKVILRSSSVEYRNRIGRALNEEIFRQFHISSVIKRYELFNKNS